MKVRILIIIAAISSISYAQNETNVLPLEGNIGIGTDSATCKLDVRGQTRMEGDVLIDGALTVTGAAEFILDLKTQSNLEVEQDAIVQKNLSVAENASFSGDVKMENLGAFVTTAGDAEIIILQADGELKKGSLGDLWGAMSAAPVGIDYCLANDGIPQWWTGLNKLYTACPDVNVGIATADPTHKLTVIGTTYAQKFLGGNSGATVDALMNLFAQNNTQDLMNLGVKIGGLAELLRFVVKNNGNIEAHSSGSGTALTLYNGTGNALVVYANNNTKILQLEDNGILSSREIKVNTNTWPDYVFEENHKLMTLPETEKYISENGRLPGVPGANRIINEGLNVGEMQVTQMEKLEEVYLHLIDLDKRVRVLEDENEDLRKENELLKNNNR
jgi:hypothetical protein